MIGIDAELVGLISSRTERELKPNMHWALAFGKVDLVTWGGAKGNLSSDIQNPVRRHLTCLRWVLIRVINSHFRVSEGVNYGGFHKPLSVKLTLIRFRGNHFRVSEGVNSAGFHKPLRVQLTLSHFFSRHSVGTV